MDNVLKRGFDSVLVLDSEVIQHRKYPLRLFVENIAKDKVYRYSPAANHSPLMAKIQHDSIRSVVNKYDTSHPFANSYGWFDNICVYRKDIFYSFLDFMASGVAAERKYSLDYKLNKVCSRPGS